MPKEFIFKTDENMTLRLENTKLKHGYDSLEQVVTRALSLLISLEQTEEEGWKMFCENEEGSKIYVGFSKPVDPNTGERIEDPDKDLPTMEEKQQQEETNKKPSPKKTKKNKKTTPVLR